MHHLPSLHLASPHPFFPLLACSWSNHSLFFFYDRICIYNLFISTYSYTHSHQRKILPHSAPSLTVKYHCAGMFLFPLCNLFSSGQCYFGFSHLMPAALLSQLLPVSSFISLLPVFLLPLYLCIFCCVLFELCSFCLDFLCYMKSHSLIVRFNIIYSFLIVFTVFPFIVLSVVAMWKMAGGLDRSILLKWNRSKMRLSLLLLFLYAFPIFRLIETNFCFFGIAQNPKRLIKTGFALIWWVKN